MVKVKRKSEAESSGFSMCDALGINPFTTTLLGCWRRPKRPDVLKRKGAKDKQMVSLTMIQSCYLPDGTEKFPDRRVSLNAGTTYSIPVSVAKVLLKKGLAEI